MAVIFSLCRETGLSRIRHLKVSHIKAISRKTTVKSELGIHARPAAMIAKAAADAVGEVWLVRDGEKADATSIIDILILGCAKGVELEIGVEDASDRTILDRICELIESDE
jgi:phosphocarrier protein HPr